MTSLKVQVEEAAAKLDTDSLKCLIDNHSVPDLLDSGLSLDEILAYAALADHTPCIQDCLKAGAKITHEVMHNAHLNGGYETYRLLVPAGLDVNYHFGHAGGPLTEAVMEGNLAWITFLLQSGANPNTAALAGYDAIEIAIKEKLPLTVVQLLVDHGAEFPRKGLLPLAAISGDIGVIEYLLQNGINPNERTDESFTVPNSHCLPLHLAAEWGHVDTVNLLLHYGADVEAKDSSGATALEKASSAGHSAVANLLKAQITATPS
jgi:ankyrin repeat protein